MLCGDCGIERFRKEIMSKRNTDTKRTVSEIKSGILNHYGEIEKHPSNVKPIFLRKPYESVRKVEKG